MSKSSPDRHASENTLKPQLNAQHPLVKLAETIDWQYFEEEFQLHVAGEVGRPSLPTRLMVGLHYLKALYDESDESLVQKWTENPYWQYFCGEKCFQHELPCHPTSLVKWRQRIGSEGVEKMLKQVLKTASKCYSVYAPEVECIAKGKVHKHYEFGCKVAIVTTSHTNWIVGIEAHHGNPYDGATLAPALEQVTRLTGITPNQALVDQGFRGTNYHPLHVSVLICDKRKRTGKLKRLLKRRSAIEPVIGHSKQEHGLQRNYLQGRTGDQFNALLAGCGFNLRKLYRFFDSIPVASADA